MQLRYKFAVISFCPDLTDPRALSYPVGLVLMGKTALKSSNLGVALALTVNELPDGADAISSSIIKELPRVLQSHIDEAAVEASGGEPRIDFVMHRLQQGFRNSLFVSHVSEDLPLELGRLHAAVVSAACEHFLSAQRKAGTAKAARAAAEAAPTTDEGPGYAWDVDEGEFRTQVWPLPVQADGRPSNPGCL